MQFRQIYCERNGVAIERFEEVFLGQVLHRPAKVLWPLIRFFPILLSQDRLFIREIGDLHRREDYFPLEMEFIENGHIDGRLRGRLKIRISCRRVRWLIDQNWPANGRAKSTGNQATRPL